MFVDVIQRLKFTKIQRTRLLPYPGQVLVDEGKNVQLDDIIAVASTPSNLQSVDIARGLGVPINEAKQRLVRQLGDSLDEGDIIAQSEGRIPRLVRAPGNGIFLDFLNGKAVIASGYSKIQLKAGMRGVVEAVIPERGVKISVEGSLLQGVWGNGKIGEGKLKLIDSAHKDPSFTKITEDIEPGQLLAAGVCLEEMGLINLVKSGATGLVLSAMAPRLIPLAETLPIPVIILQGFGDLRFDPEMLSILESREGDDATVLAVYPGEMPGLRPEIIIPGGEGEIAEEMDHREELAVGKSSMVLCGKNRGKTGEVVEISEHQMTFESGVLSLVAEIRTTEDQVIQVPCSNLAILKHSAK